MLYKILRKTKNGAKKMISIFKKILLTIFYKGKYKKIILFESMNGFDGNAGAVYNYLLKRNDKFLFVWFVREKQPSYPNNRNTYIFTFNENSIKKEFFLGNATVAFYDDTPIPVTSSAIPVVYLTHGFPVIKNVKGLISIPDYVTDCLCTSENLLDLASSIFSCSSERFFISGLPRNDVLFNGKISKTTTFSNESYKKIIVWLPTFRKNAFYERNDSDKVFPTGLPLFNSADEIEQLNNYLKEKSVLLVIKLHRSQDLSGIIKKSLSNIRILSQNDIQSQGLDFYKIFPHTDALLTDYSSVAFDYMLLNKPIGFVLDDIEDYHVGLALPSYMNDFPGEKIYNITDLKHFIENILNENDLYLEERQRISSLSNKYHDDGNTERIVKRFVYAE